MKAMNIKGRFKIKYFLPLLGLIFLLCGAADYFYYGQKIFPGIYVKDQYLGNKTPAEAEDLLENLHFTFVGPEGTTKKISLESMGIETLTDKIITQSYQKGRERMWPFNYLDRLHLKKGFHVNLSYEIQQDSFNQRLDELINTFNSEAKDAYFEIVEGNALLVPEKAGFLVQKEKLSEEVLKTLEQKDTSIIVTVPGEEIPPVFTSFHFEEMGITHQMGSFTTLFDASYETRVHNIELASSILHEHLLAPGEIFSFNGIIGDTTPGKGYKEALVIQGGEFTTGFGGGVCQVSTTLYNAALLSNLPVIERHNHRFLAAYVPPGRDAAVSYGIYDLKFRNNRDHYILVLTHVENGEITMALVGSEVEEEIEINTRFIHYIEPHLKIEVTSQLAPGEEEKTEGKPGGTVEAWKIVRLAEGEEYEEKLSVDSYQPYPAVIRRGRVPGN